MDASLRLRSVQHDKTDRVIPNAVRNPVWMLHFAYASLSMTRAERCHSEHPLLCHSERSEESSMDASLRLCFAQHDKTDRVIPNAVRNPAWMLHFAYAPLSMTRAERCHSEHPLLCHSERERGIHTTIAHGTHGLDGFCTRIDFPVLAKEPAHGYFTALTLRSA